MKRTFQRCLFFKFYFIKNYLKIEQIQFSFFQNDVSLYEIWRVCQRNVMLRAFKIPR